MDAFDEEDEKAEGGEGDLRGEGGRSRTRTALEDESLLVVEARLQHEQVTSLFVVTGPNNFIKERLIRKMEALTSSFDAGLLSLARKRKKMAVGLKYAEVLMLHAHERLREDRAAKDEDRKLRLATAEAEGRLKESEEKVRARLLSYR